MYNGWRDDQGTYGMAFRNNFDRVGAYVSYPMGQFVPSAGYQYRKDDSPDGTTFNSNGAFVEGTYLISKYATVGARYDWFRPITSVESRQWAFTPYINIPFQNGLQLIAEYTHRDFQIAPAGTVHRSNDSFQLWMIFIQ